MKVVISGAGEFGREVGVISEINRMEKRFDMLTFKDPQITQMDAERAHSTSRLSLMKTPSELAFSSNDTRSFDASHLPLNRGLSEQRKQRTFRQD